MGTEISSRDYASAASRVRSRAAELRDTADKLDRLAASYESRSGVVRLGPVRVGTPPGRSI